MRDTPYGWQRETSKPKLEDRIPPAPITVCDTKVIYDSQFEADVAVAKMSYKTGEEFKSYVCYRHFHISHADPTKRRGAGKGFWRCPHCKKIEKKSKRQDHKCSK